MGCFCHRNVAALKPASDADAAKPASDAAATEPRAKAAAEKVQAMADWLSQRALPAPAWDPDPAWLSLDLPHVALSASAVATLTALAQLQVSARAVLGDDVALSGPALPRLVKTLATRLPALSQQSDAASLASLCRLDAAADRVQSASEQGLLSLSPATAAQHAAPGGVELARWLPWLKRLQALAPLIAVSQQLGGMAELSAAIRPLLGLSLPALGNEPVVAQLATRLAQQAQLQSSLGAAVIDRGMPAIGAAIADKVARALAAVPPGARPPQIALAPASFATPQVVSLAQSPDVAALASLHWQVPALATLPSVRIGLNACMLAQVVSAALGTQSVRSAPCPGCDAAALMRTAA